MKLLDSRNPFSPIAGRQDAERDQRRVERFVGEPCYETQYFAAIRLTVLTLRNVASAFSSFSTTAYEMRGLGKPFARAPIDFTSVGHHGIDIVGQRRDLPPRVLADGAPQESDEDRIRRLRAILDRRVRVSTIAANSGIERTKVATGYPSAFFRCASMARSRSPALLPGRLEHDVAARDERFRAAKAGGLEQRAQAIHLHDMATDVDGPQERGVLHGVRRNRPTSTPLPRTCPAIAAITAARVCGGEAPTGGTSSVRVEREELEDVVMRRSGRRRARTAIVRTARADLARAVRQLRTLRHAFRQAPRGGRNVPEHPVQDVVGAVADRRIDVVHEQHEARDAVRDIAPRQRRRHLIAGLRVLRRDLSAVGPRGRRQRHHLDAAAAAAAATWRLTGGGWRRRPSLRRLSERERRDEPVSARAAHRHGGAHVDVVACDAAYLNDAGCVLRHAS